MDLRRPEVEQGKKSDVMANKVLIESLIVLSLSKKINRPKTFKQNKYEAKKLKRSHFPLSCKTKRADSSAKALKKKRTAQIFKVAGKIRKNVRF